jgi:hypothetical protein
MVRGGLGLGWAVSAGAFLPLPSVAATDQEVLALWQNLTGAQPTVVQREQGQPEIVWSGSAQLNVSRAQVSEAPLAAPGVTTALRTGNFFQTNVQTDWRAVGPDQTVSYAQGAWLATDDRSVLSRYRNQVVNFQIGHVAPGLQAAGGDILANHSRLGSSLGLRGLYGAVETPVGVVSAFAGSVAPSWEVLANRTPVDGFPARVQRYVRDTWGLKVEHPVALAWQVFATVQGFNDRESSIQPAFVALVPAEARSATAGAVWKTERSQVEIEAGASSFKEAQFAARSGNAASVHGSHQTENTSWQAGLSSVDEAYASPSQSLVPGLREAYLSGDWKASPEWLLGIQVRSAQQKTPEIRVIPAPGEMLASTLLAGATSATNHSVGTRAAWTPGEAMPGWVFSLQQSLGRGRDAMDLRTQNDAWSLGTSYTGSIWSGSMALNRSYVVSGSGGTTSLAASTRLSGAQFSLGHTFTDGSPEVAPSRRLSSQVFVSLQRQRFSGTTGDVPSQGVGLQFQGEWTPRFKVNLSLQREVIEPLNNPDVRLVQAQLDAAYALSERWTAEAFARYVSRDGLYAPAGAVGFQRQATTERVLGLQLRYQWQ